MTLSRSLLFLCACLLLMSIGGCGPSRETPYTVSDAEKSLMKFCQTEGQFDIRARRVGQTEWIYLPMAEPLFRMKPSSSLREVREKKPSPFSLLSLDGEFTAEKNFSLTYDIVDDVLPSDPMTYGSEYNENYTKKRQTIYQGLQETFFNINTDDAPNFIVIVIADITSGIATKNTIYLDDLKGYMTQTLPFEEYFLREGNDIFGDKTLIGDKTGRNLACEDIAWPGFLEKQMETRIRFKFTQSDFPPQKDPDTLIVAIAANTLKYYPSFEDYNGLYLYNRRQKREMLFSREQLKAFEEKALWEKQQGRTTVIHFQLPAGALSNPAPAPSASSSSETMSEESTRR